MLQDVAKTKYSDIEIESFEEEEMIISLVFDEPLYVSMGETMDEIKVSVLDVTFFESKATGLFVDIFRCKFSESLPY